VSENIQPASNAEPVPFAAAKEFRYNANVARDRTMGPKVWVESPGNVVLPTVPKALLCACHNYMTGEQVKHVDHAKAIILEGKLYLIPSSDASPETADVSWSRSKARINLSTLFTEAKVDVETGWMELYPCSFEKQTPYGPALVVDLSKYEERKEKSKKHNKK